MKYRIARDKIFSSYWAVQIKRWWWPFWVEYGNGLLNSPEDAEELIEYLKRTY
jgi:hypothetical protein